MIAKVIVDVPSKQTDRPFDYIVPKHLEPWVEVGSRVGVPFGPRVIQGFVVDFSDESTMQTSKLKAIDHVLDLSPPLTKDLVELGHWMSQKYLCGEITALTAMLPGALKAKYEKHIAVADKQKLEQHALFIDSNQEELIAYIESKGSVNMDALLQRYPQEGPFIKHMLLSGVFVESQHIKDRLSAKTMLTVYPSDSAQLEQALSNWPARAAKQRQALQFLAEHNAPILLKELLLHLETGAGTIKALEEKGLVTISEVEVFRDPYAERQFQQTKPMELTDEQQGVYQPIKEAVLASKHEVFLLHGVTGSGKTEVYLQSIQTCMDQGKEAIVLVPEISLTPQMVERFKGRFGDEVAVLHSRLSNGERFDEWRKIAMKQVKMVVGARSAIFAPFTNIGLIIIDEEHESSYKQEESPKYHAREVSVARAKLHNAAVVLGSATPSLESLYRTKYAEKGDEPYKLLRMTSRVQGRPLPAVHVVDMREQLRDGNRSMFSRPLHKAIEERLQRKEQMVLLLNRRGYSTFVMCRSCGYVAQCPHCDISLTYHQTSRMQRCHYCGYAERELSKCPSCESEHIRHFGTGTQKVEEELGKHFPGIRVIRMDVDTTTEKGSHEKLLTQFRDQEGDVLLGTQMVAKGLDFPRVTLVGVIAADTVLNLPDFRSAERTFQLLTQVAGRAGRHTLPGEVIIQTYTPEHYSIEAASKHNFRAFAEHEMNARRLRSYPPYYKLILITLSHENPPLLLKTGETLANRLKELGTKSGLYQEGLDGPLEILGPVASPIPRIKDRYRFQCMVKYRGDDRVSSLVKEAVSTFDDLVRQEKLQISVDVDPQILM